MYIYTGNKASFTDGVGKRSFTNSYDSANHLLSVTTPITVSLGSGMDTPAAASKMNLFSSPTYTPAGTLASATYGSGLQLVRAYDSRFRVSSEVDTGSAIPYAIPGAATLTITGTEQKH